VSDAGTLSPGLKNAKGLGKSLAAKRGLFKEKADLNYLYRASLNRNKKNEERIAKPGDPQRTISRQMRECIPS